jgi:hypothetical protein
MSNSNSQRKPLPESNYVKTIREGAVAANIFRGNTPDGHAYLYFELSRAWRTLSGNREGYSKKFYERNAEAIQRVVASAAQWINEHPQAADGPVAEEPTSAAKAA